MSDSVRSAEPSRPSSSRSQAAARAEAIAISGVGLPSRRSSPTGLPVTAVSPNARGHRRGVGMPHPSAIQWPTTGRTAPGYRPASVAPRCKGRSTVYFPDLYVAMCRAGLMRRSVPSWCRRGRATDRHTARYGARRRSLARLAAHLATGCRRTRTRSRRRAIANPSPNRRAGPVPQASFVLTGELAVHGVAAVAQLRAVHDVVVQQRARTCARARAWLRHRRSSRRRVFRPPPRTRTCRTPDVDACRPRRRSRGTRRMDRRAPRPLQPNARVQLQATCRSGPRHGR